MSRFSDRVGLHENLFEPYKVGHLCVEASIDDVTRELVERGSTFRLPEGRRLEISLDQLGKSRHSDESPVVTVFQLRDLSWTQVLIDLRRSRTLGLARDLSSSLRTRGLAIEVTDDAYYTHLVMDRGNVDELMVSATRIDVKNVLSELGLPVPEEYATLGNENPEAFDEAEYAFRRGHDGAESRDVGVVARELGCYLHYPGFAEEARYSLVDVAPDDVVRLDVISLSRGDD